MATTAATAAKSRQTADWQRVVDEIERLRFGYSEVAEFDVTRLDESQRIQVRDANHYNPKELVERFMVQMGESTFPPIVVTSDDWIVDGNTRIDARKKRKDKFTPAIVLDVAWEGASPTVQGELRGLAMTLNSTSGLALTKREIRDNTKILIGLGWKPEQIGRAIGATSATVAAVKRELSAIEKLTRVGLDPNGSSTFKGVSLRALGSKDVLVLNDVPYKELATLSVDAGFNSTEILQTAKDARETGSDEGALEHLRKVRAESDARIKENELTGVGKPPAARQLRQHLGNVTKFVGREEDLVDVSSDPEVAVTHIETLKSAIAILSEVLRLQEARRDAK